MDSIWVFQESLLKKVSLRVVEGDPTRGLVGSWLLGMVAELLVLVGERQKL